MDEDNKKCALPITILLHTAPSLENYKEPFTPQKSYSPTRYFCQEKFQYKWKVFCQNVQTFLKQKKAPGKVPVVKRDKCGKVKKKKYSWINTEGVSTGKQV